MVSRQLVASRLGPIWRPLALALLVALLSAAGLSVLRRQADDVRVVQAAFRDIRARSHQLEAREWEAMTKGRLTRMSAREVAEARAAVDQLSVQAHQLLPNEQTVSEVETALAIYSQAVDLEFSLLDAGRLDEARDVDEEYVDPSFDVLNETIGRAIDATNLAAARANTIAEVGSLLVLMTAVATTGLLLRRSQHARQATELALTREAVTAASMQRLESLVSDTADVIAIHDAQGGFMYQSQATQRAWGVATTTLDGYGLLDLVHPDDAAAARSLLAQALARASVDLTIELRLRHAHGGWRDTEVTVRNRLAEPSIRGIVATYHDVTERKAFEGQLRQLAFHDTLSGLPNRALFLDRLEHALARSVREGRSVAVLFLDLDNFKVVNDSLGHDAGDRLLVEAARRLRASVRTEDTAARLGGDEFAILLEEVTGVAKAVEVAERIIGALRAPIVLGEHEVFVGSSIGIALGLPAIDAADQLMRHADLAMYRAKGSGKGSYAVFDPSMTLDAMERLTIEADLRHGLEHGELFVAFQPIMNLAAGRMDELEALVRWAHPQRGLIAPDQFIPIAEETGLIIPLGQWVLEEACRHTRAWQRQFPTEPPLTISVNLSGRQFQHPSLVADISRALAAADLAPSSLKLEITESVVMRDVDAAIATMHALHALGIRLAIDDFGTGYSSLGYLQRFPVDTLKIDRSFVDGLGRNPNDTAIVHSVVALAKSLNLAITAEGIETSDQLQALQSLGCDNGQGFYFDRPLTSDAIDRLLVLTGDKQAA